MKIKEFHGFVYTRATAAANFINISTGIPSDVHEYKKNFRARALCTRSTNFIDFGVEIRRVIIIRDDVDLIRDGVEFIRDGVDLIRDDVDLIRNDVDLIRDDVELIRDDVGLVRGDVELIRECAGVAVGY